MKKLILILTLLGFALMPAFVRAEEEPEHGGIVSVNLTNLSAKVKAGVSFTLTLMAEDADGKTWDVSANALFLTNDPRGTIEKNIYQPGKVGNWEIEAAYGNYSSETKIEVIPGPISRIEINPNSQPEAINLGEKKAFSATAFDKMNNLAKNTEFAWSHEGDLGKIDANGVFEGVKKGAGNIIATANEVSGSVKIEVKEKTTLPVLTPETENAGPAAAAVIVKDEEENTEEENKEGQVAGIETAQAEQKTEENSECRTFAWYWWLMILIAYLAVMILYYFTVRKSKSGWWWFFPLVLTVAVFWIYFQYSCNSQGWWPWVAIIMALLITLFRPKKFFEEPKEPTF